LANIRSKKATAISKWKHFAEKQKLQRELRRSNTGHAINRIIAFIMRMQEIDMRMAFDTILREVNEKKLMIRSIKKLQKNIFNQKYNAFQMWKASPPIKKIKREKAIWIINQWLLSQFKISKKTGFDALKTKWQETNEIKRRVIYKMKMMAEGKKKFWIRHWSNIVKAEKELIACKNIFNLFNTISYAIQENLAGICLSDHKRERQLDVLRTLVRNNRAKMRVAFLNWYNWMYNERLAENSFTQDKANSVRKLVDILNPLYQDRAREFIGNLKEIMRQIEIKKGVILKIIAASQGKLSYCVNKWRINSLKLRYIRNSGIALLLQIAKRYLLKEKRFAFGALKENWEDTRSTQRQTMRHIIYMMMSKKRNAFITWKREADSMKQAQRYNSITDLFGLLVEKTRVNTHPLYLAVMSAKKKQRIHNFFSTIEALYFKRMKSGIQSLIDNRDKDKALLKKILTWMDHNCHTQLKDSFFIWRKYADYATASMQARSAVSLFDALRKSLKVTTHDLYDYHRIDYGKKMIIKKLYYNWSTRKSALFQRWKEYVHRQKLLERAITFGKIIISCDKNREYVLREALRIWQRNKELKNYHVNIVEKAHEEVFQSRYEAASSKIQTAFSKLALKTTPGTPTFGTTQIASLIFDKPEERENYLKKVAFEQLRSNAEKLRDQERTLSRVFSVFSRALAYRFNTWRINSKDTRIQHIEQKCDVYQKEIETFADKLEEQKRNLVYFDAISKLIAAIQGGLHGSMRLGMDGLERNVKLWEKKKHIFEKMEQMAKFKKAYVFEIWKSACTEKLLKNFYDVILLEKSILNYATSLKSYAFHRIRTTGVLEYWRTYNNALWKWKISNVEARYYTRQNVFVKRAKSLSILQFVLDAARRNLLRQSFISIYKTKLRDVNKVSCSLKLIERIILNKKSSYFNELKLGSALTFYENEAKRNIILLGVSRLEDIVRRLELKNEASSLSNIHLHNQRRKCLINLGHILERNFNRHKVGAFNSIRLCLFVNKRSYESVKIKALLRYLDNYQDDLLRYAISRIKSYLLWQRKLLAVRKTLGNVLAKYKGRVVLKKWLLKARLNDQIKATKFYNMIHLIEKQRDAILRRALRKWSFKRGRSVLEMFVLILKRFLLISQKQAFDRIKHKIELSKYMNKMVATQKILRLNRLFEEYKMYVAFHRWYDTAKTYNPWFKRAVQKIAKNSRINYQIAFWRLRDAIKVAGSNLTASKIVRCKKLFNFVRKMYEMNIAKAFWMIERYGRTDLSESKILLDRSSVLRKTPLTPERRREEGELQGARQYLRNNLLSRLLRRLISKTKEIRREAFNKWKLSIGAGKEVIMRKVADNMKSYELDYVAKFGATHILVSGVKSMLIMNLKHAFEKINHYSLSVIINILLKIM